MATFEYDGVEYSADNIVSIINAGMNEVQVRYGDGKKSVTLRGTQASNVVAMVTKAKNVR